MKQKRFGTSTEKLSLVTLFMQKQMVTILLEKVLLMEITTLIAMFQNISIVTI